MDAHAIVRTLSSGENRLGSRSPVIPTAYLDALAGSAFTLNIALVWHQGPEWRINGRRNVDTWISLVLGGSVEITAGKEVLTLSPGQVLLMPAGLHHSGRFVAGHTQWSSAVLHADLRDRYGADLLGLLGPRVVPMPAGLAGADAFLEVVTWFDRDRQRATWLAGTLIRALALNAAAQRPPPPPAAPDPRIAGVLAALERNPGLSVKELARICDLHPSRLRALFKSVIGKPPKVYQLGLLLDRATRRLAFADEPIRDIAMSLGFASENHFYRVFKDHFGCTPGTWRTRMQRPN